MCQVYHSNAKTNQHVRSITQESNLTNVELADKYGVSVKTISIYYNTNRKYGGLRKELKVRTPYEAVKRWFEIKPEIFRISPDKFYAIILKRMEQCGET